MTLLIYFLLLTILNVLVSLETWQIVTAVVIGIFAWLIHVGAVGK